jgi:hypothetical protein
MLSTSPLGTPVERRRPRGPLVSPMPPPQLTSSIADYGLGDHGEVGYLHLSAGLRAPTPSEENFGVNSSQPAHSPNAIRKADFFAAPIPAAHLPGAVQVGIVGVGGGSTLMNFSRSTIDAQNQSASSFDAPHSQVRPELALLTAPQGNDFYSPDEVDLLEAAQWVLHQARNGQHFLFERPSGGRGAAQDGRGDNIDGDGEGRSQAYRGPKGDAHRYATDLLKDLIQQQPAAAPTAARTPRASGGQRGVGRRGRDQDGSPEPAQTQSMFEAAGDGRKLPSSASPTASRQHLSAEHNQLVQEILDTERSISSSSTARSAPLEEERKELRELRAVLQNAALSVRQQEQDVTRRTEELERRLRAVDDKEAELKRRLEAVEKRERQAEEDVQEAILKWKEEFLNSPAARAMASAADEEHLRKIHRQLQQREDDVVMQEQQLERETAALQKNLAILSGRQQELERAEEELMADTQRHMDRIAEAKKQLDARERALTEREREVGRASEKATLQQQENERAQSMIELRIEMITQREKQLEEVLFKASGLSQSARQVDLSAQRLAQRESALWDSVISTAGITSASTGAPTVALTALKADLESIHQQLRQVGTLMLPAALPLSTASVAGGMGPPGSSRASVA